MNNSRRKKISIEINKVGTIRSKLDVLHKEIERIQNEIYGIRNNVESIQDEEEYSRDNMPDNLQDSNKYWKSDAACDNLAETVDILDEAVDELDNSLAKVLTYLENAKN